MTKLMNILAKEIKIVPVSSHVYDLDKPGVKADRIRVGDTLQFTVNGEKLNREILFKYDVDPIIKAQIKKIHGADAKYKFTVQEENPNQFGIWFDFEIENYWKTKDKIQQEIKVVPAKQLPPGWKEETPAVERVSKKYTNDQYRTLIIPIDSTVGTKYGVVVTNYDLFKPGTSEHELYNKTFNSLQEAENAAFEVMKQISNSKKTNEIKVVPAKQLPPGWRRRVPVTTAVKDTYIKDNHILFITDISSEINSRYGVQLDIFIPNSSATEKRDNTYFKAFDSYTEAENYAFEIMDKINKKEITEVKIVPAGQLHNLDNSGIRASNIKVGDTIQFTIWDSPSAEPVQQKVLELPGKGVYFITKDINPAGVSDGMDWWSAHDIENWWRKKSSIGEIKIVPSSVLPTSSDKGNIYAPYPYNAISSKTKRLLNDIYNTLKPIESQLPEKIRLSPSDKSVEVELRYGYWKPLDSQVAKTLIDSNKFEIIDFSDYDDERGMLYNYVVLYKENVDEIKINPTTVQSNPLSDWEHEFVEDLNNTINKVVVDNIQDHSIGFLDTNQNVAKTMFEDGDINPILEDYLKAHMLQNEVEIVRNGEAEILDSSNIDTLTEQELFEYLNDNKEIQKMLSKIFWSYYFNQINIPKIKSKILNNFDDDKGISYLKHVTVESDLIAFVYRLVEKEMGQPYFPYPEDIINSFNFIEHLEKTLSTTDISEIKIVPSNPLLSMTTSELDEDGEEIISIDYNNVIKNIKRLKPLIAAKLNIKDKDALNKFLVNYINGFSEVDGKGAYVGITEQEFLDDIKSVFDNDYDENKWDTEYDNIVTIKDISEIKIIPAEIGHFNSLEELLRFLDKNKEKVISLIPSLANIPELSFDTRQFETDRGNEIPVIVPMSDNDQVDEDDVYANGGNYTFGIEPYESTGWGHDTRIKINGRIFYYGSFNY